MDKLAKIRAEIERLKSLIGNNSFLSDYEKGCNDGREDMCDELTSFIDSLQEEPVSEDLWEASKQYALRQVLASTDTEMSEQAYLKLRLFSGFELAVAHKDGAKWKKEYMMKNAIEAYIRRNKYTKKNVLNGFDVTCDAIQKFNGGDKVKVIVIKEE